MTDKSKICGFCKWSKLYEPKQKGMAQQLVCEMPEFFLMDQPVPDDFGCIEWEEILKESKGGN